MQIAILTLPLHINYGGILQAYALQTVLERMGHEVTEINILPTKHSRKPGFVGFIRYLLSPAKHLLGQIYRKFLPAYKRVRRDENTLRFVNDHIHRSFYKSFEDVPLESFDAIVVGSDQVWRQIYWELFYHCPIDDAFLAFTKGKELKRVAYAASFGLDIWQWDEETTKRLKPLALAFDGISVREEAGVSLISECFGVHAQWVLDPTLLLNKEDYVRLIGNRPHHPHCCMSYILDMDARKQELVEQVATEMNIQIFQANNPKVSNAEYPAYERVQPPLEDWLQGFNDADFVVTDSFHACVFSIIFNVPFLAIGNAKRGLERFKSLLNMVGQDYRLVMDSGKGILTKDVFCRPNCNITALRKSSLDFLNLHLS